MRDNNNLRNINRGPIVDAIMLCIIVRHPCQTHAHHLDAVDNMLYDIMRELIDFSIIECIVGRALPGVAQWDVMGINGLQCAAMEQL
jgi:hypothetical protein